MFTSVNASTKRPVPVWIYQVSAVYLVVAFLLGYVVGFPVLVGLILLGGVVLTVAGVAYRSGMLLSVGLVALVAAGFVLADIGTAFVVITP
jgi:hypothetical protein